MYGGGKYTAQDKILPGFYYKFDSAKKDAIARSDRGKAAVGLELDWGADGEIIRLTARQFQLNAAKFFGYDADSEKLTPIREVFKNATELICYRLNGGGEKATCKWATAKCSGTRGNDITIVVAAAVDETGMFDVYTFLKDENGKNIRKDKQRVAAMSELKDNDFVEFAKGELVVGYEITQNPNGNESGEYEVVEDAGDEYYSFSTPIALDELKSYLEGRGISCYFSDSGALMVDGRKFSIAYIDGNGGVPYLNIAKGKNFLVGADLTEDAGTALTGGTNGTATGEAHKAFLDKLERVHYHCLGCNSMDETTIALYSEYQKRMSHECGKVAQLVTYGYTSEGKEIRPDSYDVIVLENKVTTAGVPAHYGIFWVIGAQAGCAVNKTVQNTVYNGEYTLDVEYTQAELALKMKRGKFMFHETISTADDSEIRVLADINSFETTTAEESEDYKQNQLIRVLYQALTDIGGNFNANWQGIVNNDDDGRMAFKGVIVKYLQDLQRIRAIQSADADGVIVEQGDEANAVVIALPINKVLAMFICYSNVTVQ